MIQVHTWRTPLVITEAWRHFCCTNFLSQLWSKQGFAWFFCRDFLIVSTCKGQVASRTYMHSRQGMMGPETRAVPQYCWLKGSFRCSRWRICSSAKSEALCSWRRRRRRSKDRRSLLWVASCREYLEVGSWCIHGILAESHTKHSCFFFWGEYGTSHFSKRWWDHPRLIERALNRDLPARMEDLEKKKKEPHIPWPLGGVAGSLCLKCDCVSLALSLVNGVITCGSILILSYIPTFPTLPRQA